MLVEMYCLPIYRTGAKTMQKQISDKELGNHLWTCEKDFVPLLLKKVFTSSWTPFDDLDSVSIQVSWKSVS